MTKILLVEDSEISAFVIRRALEQAGHVVVVASTLADALAQAAVQSFDGAVVDTQLPDGSGTTLQLPCPRVLMSADPGPGVVPKSSDAAALVVAIRAALSKPKELDAR